MNQKVKLQISSDIEDVAKISSITLEEALMNISLLQVKITQIKRQLHGLDISDEVHRNELKSLLNEMDSSRILLTKIDMRIGDVASIVGGLNSILQPKQEEKDNKDDNISSGWSNMDKRGCFGF